MSRSEVKDALGLTALQAAFVAEYLQSADAVAAYAKVYKTEAKDFKYIRRRANDVLKLPAVAEAIFRARQSVVSAATYSLDSAMGEAHMVLVHSMAMGEFSAAGQMVRLKAQLSGLLDGVGVKGKKRPEDMTLEEISEEADAIRREIRERAFAEARLVGSGAADEGKYLPGQGGTPRLTQ